MSGVIASYGDFAVQQSKASAIEYKDIQLMKTFLLTARYLAIF